VVVREINANDKRLAAYLVAEKPIEVTHLRRTLGQKLPVWSGKRAYQYPAPFKSHEVRWREW
jgi:hypothetical protein